MSIIAAHLFNEESRKRLEREIFEIVDICGMEFRLIVDPKMPPDEIRMSSGPRPEQNVRVTGLSHNGPESRND